MRNAPAAVHVVDDIQYDDAPVRASGSPVRAADSPAHAANSPVPAADSSDNDAHPVPEPGYGAIHVNTDVPGATATLIGAVGRAITDCQTPCQFQQSRPRAVQFCR